MSETTLDKPFIYLFKSCIGNCYLYDINIDKIAAIPTEIYDYLNDNMAYDDLSDSSHRLLHNLSKRGYLKSNPIKKIEHPFTNELEYQLDTNIAQITLQVTQSCNLACEYCPYASKITSKNARSHSNKKMTWETAKKALDFYAKHSSNKKRAIIAFYGGEPMLAFDLIKKCVQYSDVLFKNKEIEYRFTTNGTIMTEEEIQFIVNHKIYVMFSIDGPKEIHDIHRKFANGKGSFNFAFEAAAKLIDAYGSLAEKYISVNTVVDKSNDVDKIFELCNVKLFKEHKIQMHFTSIDYDYTEEIEEVFCPQYNEKMGYWYFLGALSRLQLADNINIPQFIFDYYNDLSNAGLSEIKKIEKTTAPSGQCVPGQRRLLVNVDGDFFPCEKVSETSKVTNIGNVREGFNYSQVNRILNVGKITEEQCKNCVAFWHCTSCVKNADNGIKMSSSARLKHCETIKNEWKSEMLDRVMIKEISDMKKRDR